MVWAECGGGAAAGRWPTADHAVSPRQRDRLIAIFDRRRVPFVDHTQRNNDNTYNQKNNHNR